MRSPNEKWRWLIVLAAVATLFVPLAPNATTEGQDSQRFLYVVKMTGKWKASSGATFADLKLLARVRSDAKLQLAEPGGEMSSIMLRDPRTLATRSLECTPDRRCGETAIAVATLPTVGSRLAKTANVEELYTDLGQREEIRDRIRLVGARGTDRELGITLLGRSGTRVDLREIIERVKHPTDRLVARFCSLTDADSESDDCLESRSLLPNDCSLATASCDVKAVGAYRVDVYTRERSMLSSVVLASGFAAIVPASSLSAAAVKRDALASALEGLAPALGDDERRGLAAAATLAVAGIRR